MKVTYENHVMQTPFLSYEEVVSTLKASVEYSMDETENEVTLDESLIVIEYTTVEEYNTLRTQEVEAIVVTLADTITVLDGDEISQGRISRAIAGLPDDITTQTWIGANGDVYSLTKPKLQEALVLAGEAQTAIWVNYATLKAAL